MDTQVLLFFNFAVRTIRWINRHPISVRGSQTCFGISSYFSQNSNYCFCAMSLRELSVCAIPVTGVSNGMAGGVDLIY